MNAKVDLGKITVEDFAPHSGEEFQLQAGAGALPLKLHEVSRLGGGIRAGGAFSLLFVAPAGPFLPQGIYPLTHPVLGTLDLFLVPLGPRHGGNCYQAIFT